MKLYRNLVNEVALTLQNIFARNRYADKAIESTLKSHRQWGSRDRRFVAEAVYDIVRNFRLYSAVAGNEKNFWFIVAVWLADNETTFPEWQELRDADPVQIRKTLERLRREPAIRFSYPDWLWKLCEEELGTELWKREVGALHEQAEVYLRVNTLKTSRDNVTKEFSSEKNQLIPVEGYDDALRLLRRENIFKHRIFTEGLIEVQDAGSQKIAPFLGPSPGHFVVDACAGAGGKSLHLAALMNNKGRIVAMDVEQRKLDELRRRANRAGVHIIETRVIETEKSIKALAGKADRLLLDVPCSGLGVLKRNPDAKWKLSEDVIRKTRELQASILERYSVIVKPGGLMVYSTCSILPSENEMQVRDFLQRHPDYSFEEERNLWPSGGTDGFYMARLKRQG